MDALIILYYALSIHNHFGYLYCCSSVLG